MGACCLKWAVMLNAVQLLNASHVGVPPPLADHVVIDWCQLGRVLLDEVGYQILDLAL